MCTEYDLLGENWGLLFNMAFTLGVCSLISYKALMCRRFTQSDHCGIMVLHTVYTVYTNSWGPAKPPTTPYEAASHLFRGETTHFTSTIRDGSACSHSRTKLERLHRIIIMVVLTRYAEFYCTMTAITKIWIQNISGPLQMDPRLLLVPYYQL